MVKIYLRSVEKDGKKHLALFDSNGNGDINNLTTVVPQGSKVIWKLDCCSGIKSITRIYSKEDVHPVFKSDPRKRFLFKEFVMNTSESEIHKTEAYTIEYIPCGEDKRKVSIDPYIQIDPPPPTVNKKTT